MSRKRTEILSPDREKVAELLRTTCDPRDKERLIAARMAMTGQHTLAMIAEAVGRARSCIRSRPLLPPKAPNSHAPPWKPWLIFFC